MFPAPELVLNENDMITVAGEIKNIQLFKGIS
jgi:hypothetical protein